MGELGGTWGTWGLGGTWGDSGDLGYSGGTWGSSEIVPCQIWARPPPFGGGRAALGHSSNLPDPMSQASQPTLSFSRGSKIHPARGGRESIQAAGVENPSSPRGSSRFGLGGDLARPPTFRGGRGMVWSGKKWPDLRYPYGTPPIWEPSDSHLVATWKHAPQRISCKYGFGP